MGVKVILVVIFKLASYQGKTLFLVWTLGVTIMLNLIWKLISLQWWCIFYMPLNLTVGFGVSMTALMKHTGKIMIFLHSFLIWHRNKLWNGRNITSEKTQQTLYLYSTVQTYKKSLASYPPKLESSAARANKHAYYLFLIFYYCR